MEEFILAKMNIKKLSEHRNLLYGVAIILVVLFHAYCVANWLPLKTFKYGYIGVDIFMLMSGYCLCFSISKNSLKQFYRNRFIKIVPLFFFWKIICYKLLDYFALDIIPSIFDILWDASIVLPLFTGIGHCDWFTASIVSYYVVFPIIWKLLNKTDKYICCYIILNILIVFLNFNCTKTWEQECCVSRISIFILGTMVYIRPKETINLLCVSLVFTFVAIFFKQRFFMTAMLSPFFIILLILSFEWIVKKGGQSFLTKLSVIGNHSLETYYGGGGNGILIGWTYIYPFIGTIANLLYVALGAVFLTYKLIQKIFKK